MLILEGIDGTGKTTLAEKLSKEFNTDVFKMSYTEKGIEHFTNSIQKNHGLIFDRQYLSHYIYPQVFQDSRKKVSVPELLLADLFTASKGYGYVYCKRNINACKVAIAKRGDEYITSESQLDLAHELYEQYFIKTKIKKYEHHFGHDNLDLPEFYNKCKLNSLFFQDFPDVLGNTTTGGYLFICNSILSNGKINAKLTKELTEFLTALWHLKNNIPVYITSSVDMVKKVDYLKPKKIFSEIGQSPIHFTIPLVYNEKVSNQIYLDILKQIQNG